MGCDIHLHIEIKLNGRWEHFGCPNIDRNYSLFSKMAGIRQVVGVAAITQPKGLPKDLTCITQFDADYWKDDRHGESWLDKHEIVQLSNFLEGMSTGSTKNYDLECDILHCYLFGNSFAGLSKYPGECREGVSDVRFVFWFDN